MLGFGEAARAFVSGWRASDAIGATAPISTYDIKHEDQSQRAELLDACRSLGVDCAGNLRQALAGRAAVFSLVTADRALEAAQGAAAAIERDCFYLDCNSCSPSTKNAAAELINSAGGRYVDIAVMAPVHPRRHRTPMLISGSDGMHAHALLGELDMSAEVAGDAIGQASAIKMLRSVMVKGLEALTAECMLAARRAGVEQAVLASLQASDPGFDWAARSAYNLERMMVHGARRAAEMDEVAATLRDLGLPDRMASATAQWQRQIAGLALSAEEPSLAGRADRILERLGS